MCKKTIQYTRLMPIIFSVVIGSVATALLLIGLQTVHSQSLTANTPDPNISFITVTVNHKGVYDPAYGAAIAKTIYFSNVVAGEVDLTFDISGTAPLTLTAGPAWGQAERTYITTGSSPWLPVVTYTLPTTASSQAGVPYAVVGAAGPGPTVVITYTRDVTAPTASIQTPLPGYITQTAGSLLSITGMADDNPGGSGVQLVQIMTDTTWMTATGADVWQYEWSLPLADGAVYTISARAKDNLNIWQTPAVTRVITIDNVAPDNAAEWSSPVPTNTWQMTSTAPVTWTAVFDGSGVDYYYLWDQTEDTELDQTAELTAATAITGVNLPDGANWLHLRARDGAGNWAIDTLHIGPFLVDTQPPTVTITTTSQLITMTAGADFLISGTVTDGLGSGVQAVTVTVGAETHAAVVDNSAWVYTWTVPSADNEEYPVTVTAQDAAGNSSPPTTPITLTVDNVAPDNPAEWSSPVPTSTWQMTSTVPVTWTAVFDGSGVDYYYLWDQTEDTELDQTAELTAATAITGVNLPDGANWLHLRARDGAGNWAIDTLHIGPFLVDTQPPTVIITAPVATVETEFIVSWIATDTLSTIAAYNARFQRSDEVGWTPLLTETISTTLLFTAERGYAYTFQVQASDEAGNWSGWAETTTRVDYYLIFLPVIKRPAPEPTISWEAEGGRSKDVTSFVSEITLLVEFDDSPPTGMRVWEDGSQPEDYSPFSREITRSLSSVNGLKTVFIQFEWASGAESAVYEQSIYLLRNGDFHDDFQDKDDWEITDKGLAWSRISTNDVLRLGWDGYACNGGVPLGSAEAQLTLSPAPGYVLRFDYTVYTQDRLGGPNNGLYDSFDVYINTDEPPDILRTGNLTQPTNCPIYHIQSSPANGHPVYLGQYSDEITITFANWSRFDNYYNTYTDLQTVWVTKE